MKQGSWPPGHHGEPPGTEGGRRERVGDGYARALTDETAGEFQRVDHDLRLDGDAFGREHGLDIVAQLGAGTEHDQGLRREVAGAERFASGEGMPGGQDDDGRQAEQGMGLDPGIVQRQGADPQIEGLVGHGQFQFATMNDGDVDFDFGMSAMEARHRRRQQAGGETRHAHDPQTDPRAARHALGDAGQVVDRHQDTPHLGEEAGALRRRHQAHAVTVEEAQPGAVLQSRQQAARRGLAHVQRLRRGGQASQFHDPEKKAERLQLHI